MKTLLTFALCLLAVPALAALPAPAPSPAAPAAMPGAPAFVVALMPAPLAEATTSVCTANCWDGSTVTCSGTSCTAQDSVCSQYQQGQCWSDLEGTKKCPLCDCSGKVTCTDLNGQSCARGYRTCYEPYLNCRPFTCSCNNHQWLCP